MGFIHNLKKLPPNTKRLLGMGVIIALTVALPLFVWGVVNITYDIRERAQEATPTPSASPSGQEYSCGELEITHAFYFGFCQGAGYDFICFNKYTPGYQGCTTDTGEGCTSGASGTDSNIACPIPTGFIPPSSSPTPSPIPTESSSPSPSPTTTSSATPAPVPGDVNGDGDVNIIDLGIVVNYYGDTNPSFPAADINGDGIVNIVDVGIVIDNY